MRALFFFVLTSTTASCSRAKLPEAAAPESRAKTYVRGDPTATIERMRRNALARGCKVDERTSGTLFSCGDVEIWIVPDPHGMEVTCTGLPLNCDKRGRELLRDDEPDAGQ